MSSTKCQCVVCGGDGAKYKCPACSRRTCSLGCVKRHKLAYECTGKSSRTGYLPLSEYTTATLLNDYRLLEDISRVVDGVSRDEVLKTVKAEQSTNKLKKVRCLRGVARAKGIDLQLAPPGLSVRTNNKTQVVYNKKERCQEIHWTVHWLFPECEVECTRTFVKETSSLNELLEHFLDPVKGDPLMRYRLSKYASQLDNIEVLMKAEKLAPPHTRYHKLSLSNSLSDNLKGKTIVECPVLLVVIKGNGDYPLLEQTVVDSSNGNSCANDIDPAHSPGNSTGLSLICSAYN